jgi:hypothetical protein
MLDEVLAFFIVGFPTVCRLRATKPHSFQKSLARSGLWDMSCGLSPWRSKRRAACGAGRLAGDETWQRFTRLAAQSKRQTQQSALVCLAPPNQRSKARHMNIDVLVD